jgi:asparagine synthase (glutamine-hydrolysing)
LTSMLASSAARLLPSDRRKVSFEFKAKRFLSGYSLDAISAHFSWRQIFSSEEKAQLLRPDVRSAVMACDPIEDHRRFADDLPAADPIDRSSYVDIKTWLADDILTKLDRSTMAHALEARTPFLDHRIVEFAASLPANLKLSGLHKKYLLKRAAAARLPRWITHRRKSGFNAPVGFWMNVGNGSVAGIATKDLAGDLFEQRQVDFLVAGHNLGRQDNSLKLFGLLMLHHARAALRI